MDLATTISIVVGLTTTYLGSMYFITSHIGDRIRSLEEIVMTMREDIAMLKATH